MISVNRGSFGSHFVLLLFYTLYKELVFCGQIIVKINTITAWLDNYTVLSWVLYLSWSVLFKNIYAPLIWGDIYQNPMFLFPMFLFSSQCGPATPVFAALPARPARRTSTGLQSVHCWSDRKVWRVEYICCASPGLVLSLLSDYCSSEIIQTDDLCVERGKVTPEWPQIILDVGRCRLLSSLLLAVLGALLRPDVSRLRWESPGCLCYCPASCSKEQYVLWEQ